MHIMDVSLGVVLALAVVAGAYGVPWARARRASERRKWGQRLVVGCLVTLGLGNLVALSFSAGFLVPYGLAAGWLVIALLWENPFRGGLVD